MAVSNPLNSNKEKCKEIKIYYLKMVEIIEQCYEHYSKTGLCIAHIKSYIFKLEHNNSILVLFQYVHVFAFI